MSQTKVMSDLNEGKIHTDLYLKSMNRYQYLHFKSSRHNYSSRSMKYSHGLRVKIIYPEEMTS